MSRQDSNDAADVLEVYALCLLMGYKGRYGLSGPESTRPIIDSTLKNSPHPRTTRGTLACLGDSGRRSRSREARSLGSASGVCSDGMRGAGNSFLSGFQDAHACWCFRHSRNSTSNPPVGSVDAISLGTSCGRSGSHRCSDADVVRWANFPCRWHQRSCAARRYSLAGCDCDHWLASLGALLAAFPARS